MSFAAEPFGVFVDDLVGGLTGAVVREELRFDPDTVLQLGAQDDHVASTVRAHGLANGMYTRFRPDVDFSLDTAGIITFLAASPGVPKAGATWPDRGSRFYVSYERKPERHPLPRLTDRNPGSMVRTLSESFAREYAVLSRQLETVYRAGFLDTAESRDLDQVVALIGVERRTRTFAVGEVVFSRITPAPADIFIPASTKISTREVPAVTVETADPATLRAGTLSVSVPVQAITAGPGGAAKPATLTVIHRPILGIDAVTNTVALTFGGADESDGALRARAAHALETSGAATVDAIVGALMTIEGIRDQDVRVVEDYLAHPGIIKIQIAAKLDDAHKAEALRLIRETRAAGIRVESSLDVPEPPVGPPSGGGSGGGGSGGGGPPPPDPVFFPVDVSVAVTPESSNLDAAQRTTLQGKVDAAVRATIAQYGIAQTVVYRRLVANAMAVDGVYDVDIRLAPAGTSPADPRLNLAPQPLDRRPSAGTIDVVIRGALVALDVTVVFSFTGTRPSDPTTVIPSYKDRLAQALRDIFTAGTLAQITRAALLAQLQAAAAVVPPLPISISDLRYTAELVEDGLRLLSPNVDITIADEQPWLRSFDLAEPVVVT